MRAIRRERVELAAVDQRAVHPHPPAAEPAGDRPVAAEHEPAARGGAPATRSTPCGRSRRCERAAARAHRARTTTSCSSSVRLARARVSRPQAADVASTSWSGRASSAAPEHLIERVDQRQRRPPRACGPAAAEPIRRAPADSERGAIGGRGGKAAAAAAHGRSGRPLKKSSAARRPQGRGNPLSTEWPISGTVTRVAPGIRDAIRRADSSGVRRSSSPAQHERGNGGEGPVLEHRRIGRRGRPAAAQLEGGRARTAQWCGRTASSEVARAARERGLGLRRRRCRRRRAVPRQRSLLADRRRVQRVAQVPDGRRARARGRRAAPVAAGERCRP